VKRGPLFWLAVGLLPFLHFLFRVGLGFGPLAPDLLALTVLLVAREIRSSRAAGLGFGLGLLEDAFSILAFGANALTFTLLAVAGSRTRDLFVGESAGFFAGYLILGTWLRYALHWILAGNEVRGDAVRVLVVEAPAAGLYVAAVGLLLLLATGALVREPPS
jgi:rod shape-determining protein MreD